MSIFTNVAAALSFNFGDSSKLPDEYYDHLYEKDRSDEQKRYLSFLESKVGIRYKFIEELSTILEKYYEKDKNISLEQISEETYWPVEDLQEALDLLKEYKSSATAEALEQDDMDDKTADVSYAIFDTLAEDPEINNIIQSYMNAGIEITRENAEILGVQILQDMLRHNPGIYDSFREALKKSCKNLTQPFTTEETRRREGGEIAMEVINNPELNDGLNSKPDSSGSYIPNFSMPAQSPEDTKSVSTDPSQEQTSQAQGSTETNQSESQSKDNQSDQPDSQNDQTAQQQSKGGKSKK